MNFVFDESKTLYDLTTKLELPVSIEIETSETFANVKPSMNSTPRGIVMNLSGESENAYDSMPFNCGSHSNPTDDRRLHSKNIETVRMVILPMPRDGFALDRFGFSVGGGNDKTVWI
jgi:hypothetical protein